MNTSVHGLKTKQKIRMLSILSWTEQGVIGVLPTLQIIYWYEWNKPLHPDLSESQSRETARLAEKMPWASFFVTLIEFLLSWCFGKPELSQSTSHFCNCVWSWRSAEKKETSLGFWIVEGIQIPNKNKSQVCKH